MLGMVGKCVGLVGGGRDAGQRIRAFVLFVATRVSLRTVPCTHTGSFVQRAWCGPCNLRACIITLQKTIVGCPVAPAAWSLSVVWLLGFTMVTSCHTCSHYEAVSYLATMGCCGLNQCSTLALLLCPLCAGIPLTYFFQRSLLVGGAQTSLSQALCCRPS